jgi:uncharacterized protein (TIGR00255 family)
MILSMTGYGKAIAEFPGRKMAIEVKSLNSKGLDLTVKLPGVFRDKEMEVRNLLSQQLERGKIELYISAEKSSETAYYSINKPVFVQYYNELKTLLAEMNDPARENLASLILRIPDVLQNDKADFTETDWMLFGSGIEAAVNQLKEFRQQEGFVLETDIRNRLNIIVSLQESLDPLEKTRIHEIREKMRNGFENLAKQESIQQKIDANRFEQELIYYLEKLDITEERVRLKKHCDYFLETIGDVHSQGKKLGFIAQEIGREINTIGSKANDAAIQKIVVQMKDELEKIKEQLLNIL